MHTEYHKEYSPRLGRDMEFKVYGHGGKPVLVYPCQNGRFFDWEGFGMLDTLGDYLEGGKLQLFTADTIDGETVSAKGQDPYGRVRRHEAWFGYITEELVPRIREINGTGQDLLVTGFSMGAYHAGNTFFRRPDIFDSVIALSGLYDTEDMYGGYMDEVVYANSPVDYMANLPADHPYIGLYNSQRAVICVGQGPWEIPDTTYQMKNILESKGIHTWVDVWGHDCAHDWPWWYKQVAYFLPWLLGQSD